MKVFEILSGRCLVVEMPETKWPYRNLNFKIRAELGKLLAGKMLVRGSNSAWQEVDLPPGNWRIIGMLSEVREEQAAGLVESIDYDESRQLFSDYVKQEWTPIALESLDSAILAEGYYMDSNPYGFPTETEYEGKVWRDEVIEADIKAYNEAQSRVLCRERCLLLGRDPDRDVDYEKEMPRKQWPSTKYIARKVSSEPCIDPLAPYQVTVTVQIDQFDNVILTCPAGHTFSAKSEGLADFFSREHFNDKPK